MRHKLLLIALTVFALTTLIFPVGAFAAAQNCSSSSTGIINPNGLPQPCADQNTLNDVLTIVFVILGAIALLMVVISGFRYIRAGSNETILADSRRQLIHALVGLVVAASAAIIVNFVLGRAP